MIRQALAETLETAGVNGPENSHDLAGVRCIQVAQTDDRRLMQTTRPEIRIGGLDKFVPVGLKVLQLCADSAKQQGLVGAGQVGQNQGRPQLGRCPAELG